MEDQPEPRVRSLVVDEHPVYVVDELFRPEVVGLLDSFFANLSFRRTDFDTPESREVLHLKHEFEVASVGDNPLLGPQAKRVATLATKLFAGRDLTLDRIYCTEVPYGDVQHAHYDKRPGVTAIYFARSTWEERWHGETVLYDSSSEPLLAIAPRPGRLLLFPADVFHRGGVPSRHCLTTRITTVFKFAG